MPAARTILDGGGGLAVVAQDFLRMSGQIGVVNHLAVHHDFQFGADQRKGHLVPLLRLIDLLAWRDGAIDAAGEFGGLGLRVVAEIRHLHFHAIERRIALGGGPQGQAAVAARAEPEFIFQLEIAVFRLADEPAAAVAGTGEHAILHRPHRCALGGIGDVRPMLDHPAGRRAVLGKQRLECGFGRSTGGGQKQQ